MTDHDNLLWPPVTEPYVGDRDFTLYVGDAREVLAGLPTESVHCVVTSPPYWGLRDYDAEGQLGLEPTPEEYVAAMVGVFREARRVLRRDGTAWLNIGDSYASVGKGGPWDEGRLQKGTGRALYSRQANRGDVPGLKPKDLVGVPWMLAFALRADGWWLRSDIIWSKPNPMPESVTDRPTKAHEYVFLLSKSARYFYDEVAAAEPATWYGPNGRPRSGPHAGQMHGRAGKNQERKAAGLDDEDLTRNARTVWTIQTQQFADAHFAVFPEELPRRCILAGCPEGGTVLDPFLGSGTTALVARGLGRRCVGIELKPEYALLAAARLGQQSLLA